MGRVVVVLGLVVLLSGCVEHCVTGEVNACACTDGRAGLQICVGTFQPCVCNSWSPADAGGCFNTSFELNPPLRLAVGAGATVEASSDYLSYYPSSGALRYSWALRGEPIDGGLVASQSSASVQFGRPGTWWLEVDVSSQDGGCHVGRGQGGLIEVVPTTTLPFVVVDATCCDGDGHAYVVSDGPPTLWRLDGDQASAPTSLAGRPRRLALSDDGSILFVGQYGFVSTYRVPSLELQWEVPVNGIVDALAGTTQSAWLFTSGDAIRLDLDSGTLTSQTTFNRWTLSDITAAIVASDGSLVLENGGDLVRAPVTAGVLGPPFTSLIGSCRNLWGFQGRTEFFNGCGRAFEPAPDGGFIYQGIYAAGGDWVRALGRSGDGRLVVVSGHDQGQGLAAQFRWVDVENFAFLEARKAGLWSAPEAAHQLPRWVLSGADAGASAVTPAPSLGLTWVELLP